MADSCTLCGASPPAVTIKRCAKCSTTPYCSRDCQKADWKSHKKTCGKSPSASSSSPSATSNPLTHPITTPFTRLDQGTYLHDLPEQDVYALLIDAYRLRVSDVTNLDGAAMVADEIFMDDEPSAADPFPGFRHFLNTAQFCSPAEATGASVLPPWWSAAKRRACDLLAAGRGEEEGVGTPELRAWCDLRRKAVLDKGEVSARYGSPQFPMQLRMLAEAVYQRGVGGMPGTSMRKVMASMEGAGAGGMQGSMVDIMTGSHSRVR